MIRDTIYHDYSCMVMRCAGCNSMHYAEFGCRHNEEEQILDEFSVICDDCGEKISRRKGCEFRCVVHTANGCQRYDDNESRNA